MLDLYETCVDEYTIICHKQVLKKYSVEAEYSNDDIDNALIIQGDNGYVKLSGVYFPWANYFMDMYKISSTKYRSCSNNCDHDTLEIDVCIQECNTLSCGYSTYTVCVIENAVIIS